MKKPNIRTVVSLAVLWIAIGGIWFAGLNWSRWIGGADTTVEKNMEQSEAEPVIYTLDAAPESDPLPEPAADAEPARSMPSAEPADEPAEAAPDPDPAEPANPAPAEEPPEKLPDEQPETPGEVPEDAALTYVLNTNTKKIHLPDCSSVKDMKESNKAFSTDPEKALADGYEWCKRCHG